MNDKKNKYPNVKNTLPELSLLFEATTIIDKTSELDSALKPILKMLADKLDIDRSTLTILNRKTGKISIQEAYGLSEVQQERGEYKLGEGIIGRVVEKGEPIIIKRLSDEPLFLNKTGARSKDILDKIAFICVPIKIENTILGALSIEQSNTNKINFNDEVRLLTVISSIIAQAVKLRQHFQEEKAKLMEENIRLHKELKNTFKPANIIGNSSVMHQVYTLILHVCKSNTTVLIRGESGTGKELVANAIHYNSSRSNKPFIKVNCAALPETVIESELFGHEKGAFTGAIAEKKGRFELANEGTIFLDEIGDLAPHTQIKLLRVLQEKEFERVGGTKTISCDVRVIAATSRNLEDFIKKELFREDLYYRLNVFPIHLPPLRERKTDIPLLVDFFINKYNHLNNKNIRRISTPAIDMLMSYHWPGNVRELENCIERAVLVSHDDVIHSNHLPPTLQTAESSSTVFQGTLQATLDTVEKELIQDALKTTNGIMVKAAKLLGLTERKMGLRVNKYGIDTKHFRT